MVPKSFVIKQYAILPFRGMKLLPPMLTINRLPDINWTEYLARQSLDLSDSDGFICTHGKPEVSPYITLTNVFRRLDLYDCYNTREKKLWDSRRLLIVFFYIIVVDALYRRISCRRPRKPSYNSCWNSIFWKCDLKGGAVRERLKTESLIRQNTENVYADQTNVRTRKEQPNERTNGYAYQYMMEEAFIPYFNRDLRYKQKRQYVYFSRKKLCMVLGSNQGRGEV